MRTESIPPTRDEGPLPRPLAPATARAPAPPDFSGLWIPLVTPFANGRVDHDALARLVRHLRPTGIAGLVACGSTGEAAALDKDEQLAVLDTVLASAEGLPVVMGVSGYHLPQAVAWLQELARRPLAGTLVSAPHYVRPSQRGVAQWFLTLAEATPLPMIVYDIPYRTGVQIERETLLALARHPRIAALKDCGGDASKTLALIGQGELQVLAGEDLQIFSTVAQGGAGAIAASAHLATAHFVALLEHLQGGRLAQARSLWQRLLPLVEATFAEPNPGPLKRWLSQQGWMQNELRAPMTACEAASGPAVSALLGDLLPEGISPR